MNEGHNYHRFLTQVLKLNSYLLLQAGYNEGRVRGLVDVCIQKQHEDMAMSETSWLTDEYIKGLIFDTLAAGQL